MDFQANEGLRVMTRARLLSKSKALSTSRSIILSHLGEAVIKNSSSMYIAHRQNLRRLELETSWRLREIDKNTKQFIARRDRLPDPILVVDRPPSLTTQYNSPPRSSSDHQQTSHELDITSGDRRKVHSTCPGYMQPTLRSANTLPLIPSIDAYRIMKSRR